jgi:hypothetical protein
MHVCRINVNTSRNRSEQNMSRELTKLLSTDCQLLALNDRLHHDDNPRSNARTHGKNLYVCLECHSHPKRQHHQIPRPRRLSTNLRTGKQRMEIHRPKRSIQRGLGHCVSLPFPGLFGECALALQVFVINQSPVCRTSHPTILL